MWFCTLISYSSHAIKMWRCRQKNRVVHSLMQSMPAKYGLMSSTGVPSNATSRRTNSRFPSRRIRSTTPIPIGYDGRGPGGKNSLLKFGMRRSRSDCGAIRMAEPEQDIYVRVMLHILQSFGKFRQGFSRAFCIRKPAMERSITMLTKK